MNLPNDPYILLSYINTKLRDEYSDLDSLCDALGIERATVENTLAAAGFEYIREINQFR